MVAMNKNGGSMSIEEADKFVRDWQKAQRKYWIMEARFLSLLALVVGYFIGVFT